MQNILGNKLIYRLILLTLVAALSAYVTLNIFGKSYMLRNGPAHTSLVTLLDGTSERPYVYRVLVPAGAHIISRLTPGAIQDSVNGIAHSITNSLFLKRYVHHSGWKGFSDKIHSPNYQFSMNIMILATYLALCAYALTLHQLSVLHFPHARWVPLLSTLLGLFALLPFITRFFKIYDAPTLLFSALCLFFMSKQKWKPYLITFAIGCLNKETMILQTGVFTLLFATRMDSRKFFLLLVGQVAIWAFIKYGINLWYADIPGKMYKYRVVFVVASISKQFSAIHLIVPIVLYWLVIARWKEIPSILKHSLWTLPACAAIYYFVGFPHEYRVFFECFPGITLIAGYTLFRPLSQLGQS